ncbi:hypothetical protein ACSBR2_013672 [Camellia fascicularis]
MVICYVIRNLKGRDRDISIIQGNGSKTGTLEYIVEIVNTCLSDDFLPSNIHLHCGQFASANLVNPQHFKRPSIDDCLMNGGKLLKASQLIRFSYSNRVVGSVLVEAIALIGNE